MGVYIKNQEMPTTCSDCFYSSHCNKCMFGIELKKDEIIYYIGKKPDDCPLVEIKDG